MSGLSRNTQNAGLSSEALGKISGLIVDVLSVAGHLPNEDAERIRADMAALKAELDAAQRPGPVKHALTSVKRVLENAASGMMSSAATPKMQDIISRIAHVIGAY
jgi:hypothetical protein